MFVLVKRAVLLTHIVPRTRWCWIFGTVNVTVFGCKHYWTDFIGEQSFVNEGNSSQSKRHEIFVIYCQLMWTYVHMTCISLNTVLFWDDRFIQLNCHMLSYLRAWHRVKDCAVVCSNVAWFSGKIIDSIRFTVFSRFGSKWVFNGHLFRWSWIRQVPRHVDSITRYIR